jgi:hypothetical protein
MAASLELGDTGDEVVLQGPMCAWRVVGFSGGKEAAAAELYEDNDGGFIHLLLSGVLAGVMPTSGEQQQHVCCWCAAACDNG